MADLRRVIEIDVKQSAQAVATMRDIARNAEAMEKRFDSLVGGAKKFGAAFAAAFSVDRVVGALKETLDQMDEIGKRSQRLGIGTEALSAFTHQAKLADVSVEQLDVAMVKMNKALADMDDASAESTKALKSLGVTATDPQKAFEQIAEAFAHMDDGAKKTAAAVQLFGKAGAQLIPMLNEGAAGIQRAREEAERLGIVLSKDAAAAAEAFNDSMTVLQAGVNGARLSLVSGMLPALNQVAEALKGSTESGERFKSFGEGIGIIINGATQVLLGFAGVVEVIGRGLATFAAAQEALVRGNFREARTIIMEFGRDADKIFNDYADRIKKLREAPPVITARVGAGGVVDPDAEAKAERARKAAAAAAKEAERAALARTQAFRKLGDEAERAAKALSDAAGRFSGMTQEGRIEAINNQLLELQMLEEDGAISATRAADARAQLERQLLKEGDAHQQLTAELLEEADAARKLEERREALDAAVMEGTISVDAYMRKVAELDKTQAAAAESTEKTADKFLELGEAIQRSVEGWSGKAADAIVNFAHGAEVSISKMVTDVLGQFERMALQILILDPIFKAFGETLKGMSAGGFASLFAAEGAAFGPGGQLMRFARGGVVSRPTLFKFAGGTGVMGEAGPEAIMPLKRSASGALGVEASNAGVQVNIINNAGADVGVEHSRDAVTGERVINVMVERAVQDGFARGRFDSLMSSTYGVNRRGR